MKTDNLESKDQTINFITTFLKKLKKIFSFLKNLF